MELLEVFYNPSAAFVNLRGKKWAWVIPTLLSIALTILSIYLLLDKYSALAIVEQSMREQGQDMPPGGMDAAIGMITASMYVMPIVMSFFFLFLTALVLLGIVKGFSGETKYPDMLNAVAYASWAFGVVSTVLFQIMLMTSTDLASFNLNNPIPLNAAYFLSPEDVGKATVAFVSGFNLLNFYFIYMLSLGTSKLSERVSTGKVMGPLIGIYVLYILMKTGGAALF